MSKNDDESISRAGKRRREEEGSNTTAATDRLSDLPTFIIHHILSYLDTKSAVQTSVLSRPWRCAWKHVPVLEFHRDSFRKRWSFRRFVEKVLSLRYPLSISLVRYTDKGKSEKGNLGLYLKVVDYASSHDAQFLIVDHHDGTKVKNSYRFSDLVGGISKCDNLRTLGMRRVWIDVNVNAVSLSSGFRMLTDLVLEVCVLVSHDPAAEDRFVDPFSGFPCLKNLSLIHCVHSSFDMVTDGRSLKISGPQLLTLKLDSLMCSNNVEVYAPRLKFFSLVNELQFLRISHLSVPSLDHADIRIRDGHNAMEGNKERSTQRLISLFQGLSNAAVLKLDYFTIQVLKNIKSEFLEQQPSPFTRLKSLIVAADIIPYTVLDYFLKGSSSTKPNVQYA